MNSYFEITGGKKLYGEVVNQTSKNATLPILTASLLLKGETIITDYPQILDVENMLSILKKMDATITIDGDNLKINTDTVTNLGIDGKLSKTMRSSIFLLGSYLARFKTAMITLPGGCNIGKRPIDIHLSAFKRLGVKISCVGDNVFFNASDARANTIKLKIPSVGATENIIQFASVLKGKTTIYNAAKEPEIMDLCNFLNLAGAKIVGAGTDKITIYGVDNLDGVVYKPIGDRIVSGTIVGAVAMCGGDVTIKNACPYHNLKFLEKVASLGCQIDIKNDIIHIVSGGDLVSANKISTGFYPEFPTDLQSIFACISTVAEGETTIIENVFESRFQVLKELLKVGAKTKIISSRKAKIKGVKNLQANDLYAQELRGGAGLILIGLASNGLTKVYNIHYVDRGYQDIEKIFSSLGADIRRVCQKEKS